ncbi:MAG: ATP-dependent helicase [Acidobacteriia bacterium]|nr:ATP-dependent helicase [Terriglobia bacterium]
MSSPEIRLNPEQEAAVTHEGSPLLIIAGAGTGKTRVITERVAFLLRGVEGLRPENVVALTFTERATEVMARRIRQRLGDSWSGEVGVHTFHAFALKLVEEQSVRLRPSQKSQLLDNIDFWILLRRHLDSLQLEVFWKNAEPGKFLNNLIEFMSRAHDELVSVADYEAYVEGLEEQLQGEVEAGRVSSADAELQLKREREIARVYQVASQLLADAGAQTFGDVIASAVRLLQEHPEIRQACEDRYRAILVDEFQDTNVAQIELLHLLAQSHQNITVVGDDDQGIYRFRGASSESFTLFARKFPRFHQLKLNRNYRSTRRILRRANQLIAVNPDRFDPDKNLWTEKGEGEPVPLVIAPEPDDEALAVAAEIERLNAMGRAFRDMAVLYRAHAHRELLIRALRRRALPFRVVGLSVLLDPAVRDLLATMRFLVKAGDNICCGRTLALPKWGLTEEEFMVMTDWAAHPPWLGGKRHSSLYKAIQAIVHNEASGRLKIKLAPFVAWVESLRKSLLKRSALSAVRVCAAELQGGDAPRQFHLGDVKAYREEEVGMPVRRVLKFVEEWQKRYPGDQLKDFLQYFDFYLEAGGDISEEVDKSLEADAVRLMTVHAAKGLEFPVVFVLRLTQNYFPARQRSTLLPFPEVLRKEGLLPPGAHIHEERRLGYVAMTRAQEILILTAVTKPRWKLSEFVSDIQRDGPGADADLKVSQMNPSGEDLANELSLDPSAAEASVVNSRLPFWALRNASAPTVDPGVPGEELRLSASSMETYKTCPMQYKFGHVYKLSGGPSAALTVGSILHECVRQFFVWKQEEGVFPAERMEEYLALRWRRSVGFEDKYQEDRYRTSALEQLRRFYEKNIHLDVSVWGQEKKFQFPIDDVIVMGRVDQVNKDVEGRVELVDYKTGRPKDQKEADRSLQLSVYALACRESFHLWPASLSFYNLENGEKITTERTAAQLELDRDTILQIAREIRRRSFPPRRNFFCPQCDFLPVCPAFEGE